MSESSLDKRVVEHDERATAVQGNYSEKQNVEVGEHDQDLSKQLTHKVDRRIIPWLWGLWVFAFIDRANIGNARIDGLTTDLRMDGNKFNVALMIFYIPYILVDVPSNWIVKRIGAGIYLPVLITGWGLTSTFLGFTRSYEGLLAARFFLGLFEGGLLGGIIVYLAMFYKRHEMLWRIGLFYTAAPISGAFGGLLATGLARIRVNSYNGWRWIFFIEGAMTVVFGLVALYFIPNSPGHAKFLTEQEKTFAMTRLRADQLGAAVQDDIEKEKFNWHWPLMAVKAPQLWFCSLAWLALLVPLYSFSLFIPTILRDLGYTAVHAQLLTVPPYAVATVFVLLTAFFSDRIKARGPLMLLGMTVSMVGFIMLLAANKASIKYGGTFLAAAGVYPCSPLVMGWLSNNTAPHYTRATAIGLQIAIANCAAFIATFTYLPANAPAYRLGHAINTGACVICIIIVAVGIFYCKWENKQRDEGRRDHRLNEQDESRLGHNHPRFRLTI